eukprot:g3416.t1
MKHNGKRLKYINLEGTKYWKGKHLEQLISQSKYLVNLNLSHTPSTKNKALVLVANHCPHLQSIDVSYCTNISGLGIAALGEGKCSAVLRRVVFSGCTLSTHGDGGSYVFKVIGKGCPNLEILEINSALTVLPGALAGSMARPRNLMDRTITELAMPFLRTVDLGGLNNAINDSDLQMIMEDRYKIEYLNLDGACRITDDGVRVLIQKKTAWGHIGHNGYPRLKTLLLTGMRTLSDVGLGWCQAGCPNLEILDLSNCPLIGDWGLRSLNVMERVRVLRMKNCQMVTVSGVRMLLVNEKDRPTPISLVLEELDFSGCNKLETTGALGLVGSHVHQLRILKLDSCSIAEAIDDSAFSSVSGGCKNLQLLSLAQSRKKKKRAPANRQLPSLAEEADETHPGSLMGILNLKPVSYHLELVDELSKKMSSSSTGAKRSGYFGFRPIDTAVATEIQRAYKEEIISEKFAARKLQRNFRAYMRMFAIWGINAKTQRRKRRMYGDIFMLALPFKYHNRPELQEMKKKADNVLFTKLMRLHFDLWNKRCLEQRRYLRFRARRVYRTWCKVVIKHWGKAAHESGIEKRRFKQIFAKLQRGKELRILLAWREYASDSKKGKRALGFLVHSTSIRIIAAWREFVSDQKQDRKRIQKAALTWVNMGKAKAIRKWFGFLQERRAYKRMIMRALNMMRNRALFQALDAFKEAIELKKNALLRAKHYFRNSILLKCYNALALEAAGRLDRIRAATLIQKRWRGKMYYDIYNKEKMEKIWAAEKIQSLYRGRKGRKKWTKKRRRKDLYAALECERETGLMEAEDKLSFLIRKETWAARTLQRHWRGKQQRIVTSSDLHINFYAC